MSWLHMHVGRTLAAARLGLGLGGIRRPCPHTRVVLLSTSWSDRRFFGGRRSGKSVRRMILIRHALAKNIFSGEGDSSDIECKSLFVPFSYCCRQHLLRIQLCTSEEHGQGIAAAQPVEEKPTRASIHRWKCLQ